MEPENELTTELNQRLMQLGKDIAEMRNAGANQADIERITADFEHEWQERLVVERRAETRGGKIEARAHVEERDQQARIEASREDNTKLRAMRPTAQIAFWESAPSRPGVNQERDLAKKTMSEFDRVDTETKIKYQAMSTSLTQSLIAIENGRDPDFLTLLNNQLEKERAQAAAKDVFQKSYQHGHDGNRDDDREP